MEKFQTLNEIEEGTANALKEKTNQDFNGRKPLAIAPDLKKETPGSELPGKDEKELDRNNIGEYKTEPLNPNSWHGIDTHSDAPTNENKKARRYLNRLGEAEELLLTKNDPL